MVELILWRDTFLPSQTKRFILVSDFLLIPYTTRLLWSFPHGSILGKWVDVADLFICQQDTERGNACVDTSQRAASDFCHFCSDFKSELEKYVEKLKKDSACSTTTRPITLKDVEEGAVNLRKVGEALAGLKGESESGLTLTSELTLAFSQMAEERPGTVICTGFAKTNAGMSS